MSDLSGELVRLKEQVAMLERRVAMLEHPAALPISAAVQAASPQHLQPVGISQQGEGVLAVLGKAMLGIAGGFLLRALAESGSLPKLLIVAIAFTYAAMWLVLSARVTAKIASTVYGATSALILAPMLWELTMRFDVLSARATAMVLAIYIVAASALGWRRNLTHLLWVVNASAAIASLALMIATHVLLPFVAVILLISLSSEFASARSHWTKVRSTAAMAADLAVWMLIFVYTKPIEYRAAYKDLPATALIAPALLLFLIYGCSFVYRTVWRREQPSPLWIAQTMLCFLLAAVSAREFGAAPGSLVLGVCCLIFSVAGYAAILCCFKEEANQRNYRIYATWSLFLFLTGALLSLPTMAASLALGSAAILLAALSRRMNLLTLQFHELIYLSAAAIISGVLLYSAHVFGGSFPSAPEWSVWLLLAIAILCYLLGNSTHQAEWQPRVAQLLSATLAVGAALTMLIAAVVMLAQIAVAPNTVLIAVLRTLTGCVLALVLAYVGSRTLRIELVWIAYATMGFIALKLLFEDLQAGSAGAIALSIFLYAITLILVPRLVRIGEKISLSC